MAKRSKDGSIVINVGTDAQKHLNRVAKREKIANEKAARREAKKAATRQRQALRQTGKRAAQMARTIQRERNTTARRKAAREARKNWRPDPNRKKRSVHPKGPFATENYNSYARRIERSKKYRPSRIKSDLWNVNGRRVITNPDSTPIRCTCPDNTQIDGGRNWLGSNAGPFNPCKHMLALPVKQLITVSRSGGGAIDGSQEGQTFPEDLIPQPWQGFAPYTSSPKAGTTQIWGGSQFKVFNVDGELVFTTSGYYTSYNFVDAGLRYKYQPN